MCQGSCSKISPVLSKARPTSPEQISWPSMPNPSLAFASSGFSRAAGKVKFAEVRFEGAGTEINATGSVDFGRNLNLASPRSAAGLGRPRILFPSWTPRGACSASPALTKRHSLCPSRPAPARSKIAGVGARQGGFAAPNCGHRGPFYS